MNIKLSSNTTFMVSRHLVQFAVAMLAAGATYFLMPEAMEEGARRMAAIFSGALVLWVTEAIPLFATSLLVIAFESWWVALPEGVAENMLYNDVFHSLSNPVILLFLGGFILAKAVQQERIDVQMAGLLLRLFGHKPGSILAGIMLITAIFSMWMSNTATTAMMIVLVAPLAAQVPKGDRFRRGLILAVPFAANIGGVGTPIGTPPNAIALGQLADRGLHITFFEWMAMAFPLMLGALAALWCVFIFFFPSRKAHLHLAIEGEFVLHRKALIVYGTFFITVFLWITGSWHGVPTAVVAILPAAVLTVTGVISREDFNSLEWNILILIAGGIALGDGITSTGLDQWIIKLLPQGEMPFYLLIAAFCTAALIMSTLISNTVATNILLPIGLAVVSVAGSNVEMEVFAVLLAVTASFAMGLPISTPPNAIAYSTGQITSRDMLLVGGVTSIVTTLIVILTGPLVIGYFLG